MSSAQRKQHGSARRESQQTLSSRRWWSSLVGTGATNTNTARPRKRDRGRDEFERMLHTAKIGGSVVIALAAISFAFMIFRGDGLTEISASDENQLKSVFTSGDPWLVLCHSYSGPIHPLALKAAARLPMHGINVGYMNCSAPLPSGRSAFERFKLGKTQPGSGMPVMMAVANGRRAKQVPAAYLKTAEALTDFMKAVSKPRVLEPVLDEADFESRCSSRRLCLAVLHDKDLDDSFVSMLNAVLSHHRTLSAVSIDARAAEWKGIPVDVDVSTGPKLVYLRRDSSRAASRGEQNGLLIHKGSWSTETINTAISRLQDGGLDSELTWVKRAPSIKRLTRAKSRRRSSASQARQQRSTKRAPPPSEADTESKRSFESVKQEDSTDWERKRREQMEAEAQNLIQEVDDVTEEQDMEDVSEEEDYAEIHMDD